MPIAYPNFEVDTADVEDFATKYVGRLTDEELQIGGLRLGAGTGSIGLAVRTFKRDIAAAKAEKEKYGRTYLHENSYMRSLGISEHLQAQFNKDQPREDFFVTEEEFEVLYGNIPGMIWRENMTEAAAEVEKKTILNRQAEMLLYKKNADTFERSARFNGAFLVGNFSTEAMNLFPFTAGVKAATLGAAAKNAMKEGFISTLGTSAATYPAMRGLGDDATTADFLADIGVGTFFGGALGVTAYSGKRFLQKVGAIQEGVPDAPLGDSVRNEIGGQLPDPDADAVDLIAKKIPGAEKDVYPLEAQQPADSSINEKTFTFEELPADPPPEQEFIFEALPEDPDPELEFIFEQLNKDAPPELEQAIEQLPDEKALSPDATFTFEELPQETIDFEKVEENTFEFEELPRQESEPPESAVTGEEIPEKQTFEFQEIPPEEDPAALVDPGQPPADDAPLFEVPPSEAEPPISAYEDDPYLQLANFPEENFTADGAQVGGVAVEGEYSHKMGDLIDEYDFDGDSAELGKAYMEKVDYEKIYAQQTKKLEKEASTEAVKLTEEFFEEDQLYSLIRQLRSSKDGSSGISLASLKARYDSETISELRRLHPGIVAPKSKDGIASGFDQFAEQGFPDGDELINALLDAKPYRQKYQELKNQYHDAVFNSWQADLDIQVAEAIAEKLKKHLSKMNKNSTAAQKVNRIESVLGGVAPEGATAREIEMANYFEGKNLSAEDVANVTDYIKKGILAQRSTKISKVSDIFQPYGNKVSKDFTKQYDTIVGAYFNAVTKADDKILDINDIRRASTQDNAKAANNIFQKGLIDMSNGELPDLGEVFYANPTELPPGYNYNDDLIVSSPTDDIVGQDYTARLEKAEADMKAAQMRAREEGLMQQYGLTEADFESFVIQDEYIDAYGVRRRTAVDVTDEVNANTDQFMEESFEPGLDAAMDCLLEGF